MASDSSGDSAMAMAEITALQSRLTAALDRIAASAAVQAVAGSSGSDPLAQADDLIAAKAALEMEREARAAAEAKLAALEAAGPPADAPMEEPAVLRARATRFRDERNAMRDERDEMADRLDAALAASGQAKAPEPGALLAALRELRSANRQLLEQCNELRQSATGSDPELINAALSAELAALQAERAADAAELAEILEDIGAAGGV